MCNVVNWKCCLEMIKFDVSNTSYYVEVENGAQLPLRENDPWKSQKSCLNFCTIL